MRLLVAPDSFTGTLTAPQAAAAIADGWRRARPDDIADLLPLSDGGPGFVDVLQAAAGGRLMRRRVTGPAGAPVDAAYLLAGGTAYVESAQACGLHLVPAARRDPTTTTTRGVGELLAAVAREADRVVVGLGGSGTNDGGAGLLQALGWRLSDGTGADLAPGGLALRGLAEVERAPAAAPLVAASDVASPLLGPAGASRVFGPQKGATPVQVDALEAALARFADVAERAVGRPGLRDAPGAGAAGGLGFALLLLGARRESGIGLVLDATGFARRLAAADLVVTGEGSFDSQTLQGKVVAGVAAAAGAAGRPCLVLAGRVTADPAPAGVTAYAVDDAHPPGPRDLPPAVRLSALAARVAAAWPGRP